MIDLLIGLVLDNADEIIDFGAELLGLGAAAFIVYKVSDKITEENLPEFVRQALQRKHETIAKKTIEIFVQAVVEENKGNEISLSILEAGCSDLKGEKIKIGSSKGIDSSLKTGDKLEFTI